MCIQLCDVRAAYANVRRARRLPCHVVGAFSAMAYLVSAEVRDLRCILLVLYAPSPLDGAISSTDYPCCLCDNASRGWYPADSHGQHWNGKSMIHVQICHNPGRCTRLFSQTYNRSLLNSEPSSSMSTLV
ncbi:hypothetical protein PLICRDRAFT_432694 [Plicaturopsis crispa FD-325 SS-3]|uniref:Uncharacterized protein n=1 Tax=Plicaturopsis crispa FD-325 SS-3 TaxID=944288 RepID=A0A0C9SKL4_PLICR|nr:hypothetical protein PLICRDRAFT_432694 [Plicaturopsis crispa FD-325 SS-3]